MTKIFGAALLCEVNTFSPIPTTETDFKQCYYAERGNHSSNAHYYAQPLLTIKQLAEQDGFKYVESLCTGAQPGGRVEQCTYEKYRNKILSDLQNELPVDAITLYLHGAMVAEFCDDCEGDIIERIRNIVGPNVFIGVEFDPHSHLTDKMVKHANALIFIKEYPHTDYNERATDLFKIMKESLSKSIKPCMYVADCNMIGMYATTLEPMLSFNAMVKRIENETNGVLSISIIHGFPWGDVEDLGTKILVITNNDPVLAENIANALAQKLRALKGKTMPKPYSIKEALDYASMQSDNKPVVLADFSDNTGLGALGDSTFILEEVFARSMTKVALSPLYDPQAVAKAKEMHIGATIDITIGGNGPFSGKPLHLKGAIVKKIEPNLMAEFAGTIAKYGEAITLVVNGVSIVINNNRCQTFSTECFSKMGINPTEQKILIVKSSEHFRQSFAKITDKIFIVTTPGTISLDFSKIPYTKLRRDLYPLESITRTQQANTRAQDQRAS